MSTVVRLENGRGANLENVLRVARALGVLEPITASFNPYTAHAGSCAPMNPCLSASGRGRQPDGCLGPRRARRHLQPLARPRPGLTTPTIARKAG
ncbi:MAG: hypothetical protein ACYCXA_09845 [Actinomycetes bacterium]